MDGQNLDWFNLVGRLSLDIIGLASFGNLCAHKRLMAPTLNLFLL